MSTLVMGGLGNTTGFPFLPLSGGTLTGNLVLSAAGTLSWTGRALVASSADGKMQLSNNAATTGVTLTGATADTLTVRNLADGADGAIAAGAITATGAIIGTTGAAATPAIGSSVASGLGFYFAGSQINMTVSSGARFIVTSSTVTAGASVNFLVANSALTAATMTATTGNVIKTCWHRYDWTNAMVTALGGVTSGDVSVATLPAKTIVHRALIVITGTAAGTTTLSVACGIAGASYIDYVVAVANGAQAAANTVYGDATSEIGTNLYNGTGFIDNLPSFTATTTVNAHFVSTGANLSAVTGSTGTVYLLTSILP